MRSSFRTVLPGPASGPRREISGCTGDERRAVDLVGSRKRDLVDEPHRPRMGVGRSVLDRECPDCVGVDVRTRHLHYVGDWQLALHLVGHRYYRRLMDGRMPLYQLDWTSFFLYAPMLILMGYVMIYGQQYYWLEDPRIVWCIAAIIFLTIVFVLRQVYSKRPFINMQVFKSRGFLFGILLLGCLILSGDLLM